MGQRLGKLMGGFWVTGLSMTGVCATLLFTEMVTSPSSVLGQTAVSTMLEQPGNIIELPNLPSLQVPAKPTTTPATPGGDQPDEGQPDSLRLEIKLSQRRVTLYRGDTVVKRYPIAVGRPGWETPTGTFKVLQKLKNPSWIHPLKKGVSIPGGDPENPLGKHWIGFWTDGKNWIGFHGTPNPGSVGTAASHGCIRMYNKDIEELFQKVSLGTVVSVVR